MYRTLPVDQVARVQAAGIPVTSTHPSIFWIISLAEESEVPTDHELAQLVSYRDYCLTWFNEGYQELIRAKGKDAAGTNGQGPLLWDGGWNTRVFQKGAPHIEGSEEGWFYRRAAWQGSQGGGFVPYSTQYREPLTLGYLLDSRVESMGDGCFRQWTEWKAAHPGLF